MHKAKSDPVWSKNSSHWKCQCGLCGKKASFRTLRKMFEAGWGGGVDARCPDCYKKERDDGR
jgi:hypothetical protein